MKKYDLKDLKIYNDGLGWVRRHRERFFGGVISAAALVGALINQSIALGVDSVGSLEHRDWHAVGAERDWFREGRSWASDEETFRRILALPEVGQNCMRAEVVVAAFARDVVTLSAAQTTVISGSWEVQQELEREMAARNWVRMVAFRMDDGAELAVAPEPAQPSAHR